MKPERSFKTAICTDYENLLFACQKALESWRAHREAATANRFASKKTTDDLLKLQADYARAYSRLDSHEEKCQLCRFVSKIGGRNYAAISAAAIEKKSVA